MDSLLIRRAVLADAPALVAFNQGIARETEDRELPTDILTSGVEGLLTHPERGFYLVAEFDGEVVACLMVTYEWSDWRNGTLWWIQSVYVKAEHRRKGIYKRLYLFVQQLAGAERAKGEQICGFRLYVERDNAIAQTTYSNLGMGKTPYRIFEQLIP